MAFLVLNKKGQISIEFVLILLIGLLYLQTISSAVITPAIDSAKDVSNVGEARLAAEKIVNSVNELSVSPGDAKKTIRVYVPENSTVTISDSGVEFSVNLSSTNVPSCNSGKCIKTINFSIPAGVTVDTGSLSALTEKTFNTLSILKSVSTISISNS